MKKNIQICLTFFIILLITTANGQDIIFEEDFTGVGNGQLPGGWYSSAELPDDIYCFDEALLFFRQSQDAEMIFSSPEIDFTDATFLTFDFTPEGFDEVLTLEVGTMSDPENPSTFESFASFIPEDGDLLITTNYSAIISGITGSHHLAFRGSGFPYDYFILDNIVVKNVELNWPECVANVSAIAGDSGANNASISWTNPSLEEDGTPLTMLDSITIELDGIIIHTLNDPEIGGNAEAQIDIIVPGFHIFEIIAHNMNGSSATKFTSEIWIGLDTPGAVSNVVLNETNDNTVNLSWEAPTEGAHGAWFNGLVTEYKIVRVDGVEYFAGGSETTFSVELDIPGTYTFSVIPINSSGEGTEAQSNVDAFYFNGYLLWEDFWVSVPALDWSITGDGPELNWASWEFGAFDDVPEMLFAPQISFSGTSNMVSPVINTEGLSLLNLQFDHMHFHSGSFDSYSFKILTTSNGGNTWNEAYVLEVDSSIPATNAIVTITTVDVGADNFQFAFAFEGITSNLDGILIDNVRLSESFEVDLAATNIFFPNWIATGDVVYPTGSFENVGSLDVEYTATMTINDGNTEIYNSEITGSIDSDQALEVNFESWDAIEGAFVAELTVITAGDGNPLNSIITTNIEVINNNFSRTLVVCEEFTGTWCTFCPGAALGLDELVLNNLPVSIVAYHIGDIYETSECVERDTYYSNLGYPTVIFDGTTFEFGGSQTLSQYDIYLPIVQNRLTVPSPASIEILNLAVNGSTLTADIKIDSGSPIGNTDLVLHSILTESHIEEEWLGLDEVNFVTRSMYAGADGVSIDLTDQTETVSVTIELEESWDQSKSELTVFVQDTESKVVLNGNKQSLLPTSLTELGNQDVLQIYPNPVTEVVTISCNAIIQNIEIYNQIGQLERRINLNSNSINLNVSELEHGIYYIKAFSDNDIKNRKLVIE